MLPTDLFGKKLKLEQAVAGVAGAVQAARAVAGVGVVRAVGVVVGIRVVGGIRVVVGIRVVAGIALKIVGILRFVDEKRAIARMSAISYHISHKIYSCLRFVRHNLDIAYLLSFLSFFNEVFHYTIPN